MSTETDSHKQDDGGGELGKLSKSQRGSPESARTAAETQLENALEVEKNGRNEDRFLFAVVIIVILDIWALQNVETWTVPAVVGIVQLIGVLILARRLGIEEIHFWLNQLLPRLSLGIKPDQPSPSDRRKPENE